jgi:hypothetical protein
VSKSKLLVRVLVAAFAVASATDVALAAKHTKSTAAEAGTAGHPLVCPAGQVAKYHTVSGHKHWHCVKA